MAVGSLRRCQWRSALASWIGPAVLGFVLGGLFVSMQQSRDPTGASAGAQRLYHDRYWRRRNADGSNVTAVQPAPPPPDGAQVPEYLRNTAFVTLATGDTSARLAVALMQTLRDVGTQVPHLLVLLSRGGLGSATCHDQEWRRVHGREHVDCAGLDTIAPEIASEEYLKTFDRLGVQYEVVDPIPDTPYTIIPGGRQIFWGMAFNKLKVFNMTQYRKLVWLDADAYILRNVDHLMKEPMLTGAMVTACCHPNGPGYAGGGIWVVEPSTALYADLMDFISKPVPGTKDEPWHWGDMQVIRHYFGKAPGPTDTEPLWPAINDGYHGYAAGLRYLPKYASMTQGEFGKMMDGWLDHRKPRKEGFIPELWDGKRPVWRALDMRYDQCVGHFSCSPERDIPDIAFSVHFSCLQDISKPGDYASEHALFSDMYLYAHGATRYWFKRWYDTFVRAHGRFPKPWWEGPAVPGHNETHDAFAQANRMKRAG